MSLAGMVSRSIENAEENGHSVWDQTDFEIACDLQRFDSYVESHDLDEILEAVQGLRHLRENP